jgi:nucleotide-binding universal stress UspA family protein
MAERILIPLDGSPRAEMILGQVARILRREDSEILLLRVIDFAQVLKSMDPARRVDSEALRGEERGKAQAYLDDLARRFRDRGARVQGRVAEGPAAETILVQAKAERATLIALSTHGRTGLSRWLVGSVAEKVVRTSPVPVLLVRSFRRSPQGDLEPATAGELPFRKMLVPTDGSPAAEAIFEPALRVAKLFESELQVLHTEIPVILPGAEIGAIPGLPATPSEDDPVTAGLAGRFRSAGLPVSRRTVLGDAAAEILDCARPSGVDLIAMATHGRSGFSRWLLGSVAERVLRHAEVPVLLVRAEPAP